MKGHSIAGTSEWRERVENDYCATPPESTRALLQYETIPLPAWEPACGEGHIAREIDQDADNLLCTDLIDRGYGWGGQDFFTFTPDKEIKTIITNPPFNLFQEFAERALNIATHKVILFGKLQALEGKKRGTFMQNSPLKTVYVFKSRQPPLRNGSPVDEKGKPWASTMEFAWFVWELGYKGEPTIKWLE